VTVTTDTNGKYDFSVTVGTTPGKWELEAWAFNSVGLLSTDVLNASDTASIDITPTGSSNLSGFVTELDTAAKSTGFSTLIANDSSSMDSMASLLSQVTKSHADGVNFGGLAYAPVNAADGAVMIIFPADKPPVIDAKGAIDPTLTRNSNDLILDPSQWTGSGMPATVTNAASLSSVMQRGLLPDLPTLGQYDSGAGVQGWKTTPHNDVTISSQSFLYLGWTYPNTTPGACA
jgi:hypothetical protein